MESLALCVWKLAFVLRTSSQIGSRKLMIVAKLTFFILSCRPLHHGDHDHQDLFAVLLKQVRILFLEQYILLVAISSDLLGWEYTPSVYRPGVYNGHVLLYGITCLSCLPRGNFEVEIDTNTSTQYYARPRLLFAISRSKKICFY